MMMNIIDESSRFNLTQKLIKYTVLGNERKLDCAISKELPPKLLLSLTTQMSQFNCTWASSQVGNSRTSYSCRHLQLAVVKCCLTQYHAVMIICSSYRCRQSSKDGRPSTTGVVPPVLHGP